MIKKVLANSDGCKLRPAKLSQRVAPFIFEPTNKTSNNKTKEQQMPTMANNLICSCCKKEMTMTSNKDRQAKTICFLIKNKRSTSIFFATTGLEVVVKIRPRAIKTTTIVKLVLSISSHQDLRKFKFLRSKKLYLLLELDIKNGGW